MKCFIGLMMLLIGVLLSADEHVKSPASFDMKEGKSVYAPIRSSVNFQNEVQIQQNDQNATMQGAGK
ncbi:MAG: hypothetical protein WC680_01515 [Sulfuricurvum sp.]|jgi:hypothetical protein